jgi:PAS domain S-box-containing protein
MAEELRANELTPAARAGVGASAGPGRRRWWRLTVPTLLMTLVLSSLWELVLEPWLATQLGSPLGHWQHIVVSGLLVVLALGSAAEILDRLEAGQREAELARRASEARYRRVVEATPMGLHLYRLGAGGELIFEGANPAAAAILGIDHGPLIGQALESAFPSLAGTAVPAEYARVVREGGGWHAVELTYRDPRVAGCFEVWAFPSAPGELVVLFQEISARRRTEEDLRRSEERFRQLVESTRDWVWEVDSSGRYTYCSPQCQTLLGYRPDELLGRTPFDLMPPREARRVRALFGRLAEERRTVDAVENVNRHREGHEVVLETSAVPFFDGEGALVGYRGIDRDVTERHRAEEAIRTINAELEERVRRRTAELETAYHELESFSYSVSHDLRAPLRTIDGFSRALLEDYGERLEEEGRGCLERVRSATRRMGLLIDDLLSLSRVTRQEMRQELVDLSALAEDIAADLVTTHGERVELRVEPGLQVQGDPKLLRLALWNLLENAWKFTRDRAPGHVELGRLPAGPFFVRDDGAGFDMAYAHKLFTPFQRLHAPEDFPGTGIGLAIVQRVVRRHGGRIWAEATLGAGAAFFFTLPTPTGVERQEQAA